MINPRRSKILAKIADNRSEAPFLTALFAAGADVAWLNTAHQDEASTLGVIERIRSVSTRIPIMVDTKGPEIRTKGVTEPIPVKAGDHLILTGDPSYSGDRIIQVTYENFHNELLVGTSVLYDDASIELVVIEKLPQGVKCEVKSSGTIKNKKSLNIPEVHINLPSLSEKDTGFIHFCVKHNVDFIIHSFVRTIQDVVDIKEVLRQYPSYTGKIIAKIENREGFDNVGDILDHCDGLMVARGDLGAEVPMEQLPYMQKKMVEAALVRGKYCIVATEVLNSMIKNPRPTRAEVTDAANAILDGSGAVSMSGETAYGDYPIEATTMMGRIMSYTELKRDELVHFTAQPQSIAPEFALAREILATADAAKSQVIIVLAKDIHIVRALSAYRPAALIVPVCLSEMDARELVLAYGVRPVVSSTLGVAAAVSELQGSFLQAEDMVAVVTENAGKYEVKVKAFGEVK